MSKLRVYELAEQIGLTSDQLVARLKRLGITVKSNLSTVDESVANSLLKASNALRESATKEAAKEAVRGRFMRLAWPQLLLIFLFVATVARIINVRMVGTTEATIALSSPAIWGMIVFASLPLLASIGTLVAAWDARQPPAGAPWDEVDIARIGDA